MPKGPNPNVFLGLALGTLMLGGAIGYFQYTNYAAVKDSVEALRAEAKDENAVRAELETARTELTSTQSQLRHLEIGVSEKEYIPTLLGEIERTGKEAGMTVLGVRPIAAPVKSSMTKVSDEEKPKKKNYTEMNIEVRCRGNYRSVMNFVSALRMFPKIVGAKTVSLQPKSNLEEAGSPTLDATIELTSYIFNDGTPKQTAPAEDRGEKSINLSGRRKMEVQ